MWKESAKPTRRIKMTRKKGTKAANMYLNSKTYFPKLRRRRIWKRRFIHAKVIVRALICQWLHDAVAEPFREKKERM